MYLWFAGLQNFDNFTQNKFQIYQPWVKEIKRQKEVK
jgi:hypothetical protein